MISTTEQTYILTQSQKPTATELLKAMHSLWLLSPSANKSGNEEDGGDDGEPNDVALATPGAFATAFNKKCLKFGVKGHRVAECPKNNNNNNTNSGMGKSGKSRGTFKGN